MTAWLNNRRQCVKLGNIRSSWKAVLSGVPQGSVLGPLLFIIFIDDIDECVEGLDCVISKFADDTKVIKQVDTDQGRQQMQEAINNLSDWCSKWSMKFNESKCHIMHYGRRNAEQQYTMNGIPLSVVTSERDIGVLLENSLKPSLQCSVAAKRAKWTPKPTSKLCQVSRYVFSRK